MVEYCIGVDALGFPVYIYHDVTASSIIFGKSTNNRKMKVSRSIKHRNSIHK